MFVKPFLREQLVGLPAEVGKEHPAIQVNQSHSMTMLRFIFSFFLIAFYETTFYKHFTLDLISGKSPLSLF